MQALAMSGALALRTPVRGTTHHSTPCRIASLNASTVALPSLVRARAAAPRLVPQASALPTPAATPSRRQQRSSRVNKDSGNLAQELLGTLLGRLLKAAGVLALAATVALGAAAPANAARSGGRIGGSVGFSRSFGGSSGFGSSLGGSASSFGASRSLGGSYGSSMAFGGSPLGIRSRPAAIHLSSSPLAFFSPFGMGMGYYGGGGGGLSSLLFFGVFAIIMVQVLRGVLDQNGSDSRELDTGERLTVAKVQVGLLGSARDLQRDLERIASRADTSSSGGLHYVLQETVLSLMRNPDYCIYGFAKAGIERSADEAEARFNKLSLEERGKFQKETLVNVAGRSARGVLSPRGGSSLSSPVSELIVVTLLVAAEGRMKLPRVTSRTELKEALTTLGGVRAKDVLAVEVLWTPEAEDDYFTVDDLAEDYPLLNTL